MLIAIAMDEAGNSTTKSSRFRYVPNNLIEFNTHQDAIVGVAEDIDNQLLAYLASGFTSGRKMVR